MKGSQQSKRNAIKRNTTLSFQRERIKEELIQRDGLMCRVHGCTSLGTDMHECFVPRSAVMSSGDDKRLAIHTYHNCILVCNFHNLNMTHEIQVQLRRHKIKQAGLTALVGKGLTVIPTQTVIEVGMDVIQDEIDKMGLVTRFDVKGLAEYDLTKYG